LEELRLTALPKPDQLYTTKQKDENQEPQVVAFYLRIQFAFLEPSCPKKQGWIQEDL
jgi:hypothetical protein